MLTGDLSISQGTAYMDGYNILTNLRQVCKKIGTGSESNFQLSVNSNLGLLWLYFTLLCDWSRKLVPSSQPIRCKTKNSGDVVIRVFPRFKHYACFTLSPPWLTMMLIFVLIGRCDNFDFCFQHSSENWSMRGVVFHRCSAVR